MGCTHSIQAIRAAFNAFEEFGIKNPLPGRIDYPCINKPRLWKLFYAILALIYTGLPQPSSTQSTVNHRSSGNLVRERYELLSQTHGSTDYIMQTRQRAAQSVKLER